VKVKKQTQVVLSWGVGGLYLKIAGHRACRGCVCSGVFYMLGWDAVGGSWLRLGGTGALRWARPGCLEVGAVDAQQCAPGRLRGRRRVWPGQVC
jgi:hypothetical protein